MGGGTNHPRGAGLTAQRLEAGFKRSRQPMLIADDDRRWITGNAAACELLNLNPFEIAWHTMDEFTPPHALADLEDRWRALLAGGAAEGLDQLYIPSRGPVPVEFSATANVLPSRHLAVFIPRERSLATTTPAPDIVWSLLPADHPPHDALTAREREVLTLVAAGLQTAEMAERFVLSPETVNSHVQNAMRKLGSRTRAGAVTIALVTGEIAWGPRADTQNLENPINLRHSPPIGRLTRATGARDCCRRLGLPRTKGRA